VKFRAKSDVPLSKVSLSKVSLSNVPPSNVPPSNVYLHQPKNLGILQHFTRIADFEFAGHHGHHRIQVAGEQFGECFTAGSHLAIGFARETFQYFEFAIVQLNRVLAFIGNIELEKRAEAFHRFRGDFFREGKEEFFYVNHDMNMVNVSPPTLLLVLALAAKRSFGG